MPEQPLRSRRRWLKWCGVALALLLVGGELFARFYLGLGDPPLLQSDPQIEYLFKADQDCRRFGNHIKYNHYSMRSDALALHKSSSEELRVLVVGDSVVNGGVLTDQSQLATSLMQQRLHRGLNRPVFVGNISAGSWGPPNELAYLKRFGLFDTDVLVLVLSSHDAYDVPTFDPIVGTPGYPSRKPWSALLEGIQRYLIPRLRKMARTDEGPPPPTTQASAAALEQCLGAVRDMIRLAKSNGAVPIVALHLNREESQSRPQPEHDLLAQAARQSGAAVVELGPAFRAAAGSGPSPYRDNIHPSAAGQEVMAGVLADSVKQAMETKNRP